MVGSQISVVHNNQNSLIDVPREDDLECISVHEACQVQFFPYLSTQCTICTDCNHMVFFQTSLTLVSIKVSLTSNRHRLYLVHIYMCIYESNL